MKDNKLALWLGFGGVILFIIVASYFWYLYFLDWGNDGKINDNPDNQGQLVLTHLNGVNVTFEETKEDAGDTPSYRFKIENKKVNDANYILYIEDTPYNMVSDGCTIDTTLTRAELNYQLKLNGKVIKTGNMLTITDNVLDERLIVPDSVNTYELQVWINDTAVDWQSKHYHYQVTLQEVE